MKLTNKYNLPSSLVAALEADSYDNGGADLSASGMWKPPYMVALEKQNPDIPVDASDLLPSLLGKGFHAVMAASDKVGVVEKRLFTHVGPWYLSGQFDRLLLEDGVLQDYKVTSVPRFKHQLVESEWENQLNTYAFLLRRNGLEVKALQVVVFLRDWYAAMALRNLDYPNLQVQVVDLPMWDPDEALEKIEARLALHENPIPCNDEERWYRAPKVAVMREGRQAAVKLFDTEGEASAFIATAKDSRKLRIEYRKGSNLRCEEYCSVSAVCPHWQGIQGKPE
jgi:hypothetical protein